MPEPDKPITATKSTPRMRAYCARALKLDPFLDFDLPLTAGKNGGWHE
jgi:hypothetical protein